MAVSVTVVVLKDEVKEMTLQDRAQKPVLEQLNAVAGAAKQGKEVRVL